MKNSEIRTKAASYAVIGLLALVLFLIPVAGVGCAQSAVSGNITGALSATLVPDVDLDVYLYMNQGAPTVVPGKLIGSPADIKVESLSIWGLAGGDTYAFGGALVFSNSGDAAGIYSQLPRQKELWTKLSDRTIYAVQGTGAPAESLKTAISNNRFKNYNDKEALEEVARMPYGNSARPLAIGIFKISKEAVDLIRQLSDTGTASMLDSAYTWTKPQVIVIGLYAPQPIDIAGMIGKIENNTAGQDNVGIVASVNSDIPGIVVSPIAGKFLDSSGYTKVNVGDLTVYKVPLDAGNGTSIPVLINVDGNHVFAAASMNESYAEALMQAIAR